MRIAVGSDRAGVPLTQLSALLLTEAAHRTDGIDTGTGTAIDACLSTEPAGGRADRRIDQIAALALR